jgi:hypothetical protein
LVGLKVRGKSMGLVRVGLRLRLNQTYAVAAALM